MKIINLFILLFFVSLATYSCSESTQSGERTNNTVILPDTTKAIIVDVRTTEEWNDDGHANCTVNYPLDELSTKIESLKAYDKVILVCRSGNRAAAAKDMLKEAGFKNVENKGAWQNIVCK